MKKEKKLQLFWITDYDRNFPLYKGSGFIVVATSTRQAQNIYREYVNRYACFDNYEAYGEKPNKTNSCVSLWDVDNLKYGVDGILRKEGIVKTDKFEGWHSSGINHKLKEGK